jgi:hypothetical protein
VWHGNDELEPFVVSLDELLPDPENTRLHNAGNLESIRASFRRYGQQTPIVCDKDRIVRKGNGTLAALKLEGWTHVACITTNLDEKALLDGYGIADNRTSELADWDWSVLATKMNVASDAGDLAAFDNQFRDQIKLMANEDFGKFPDITNPGEQLDYIDVRVRVGAVDFSNDVTDAMRSLCADHPEWEARIVLRSNTRADA